MGLSHIIHIPCCSCKHERIQKHRNIKASTYAPACFNMTHSCKCPYCHSCRKNVRQAFELSQLQNNKHLGKCKVDRLSLPTDAIQFKLNTPVCNCPFEGCKRTGLALANSAQGKNATSFYQYQSGCIAISYISKLRGDDL